MKRNRFKKETSLTLMKGEKEIISVCDLAHMNVILDNDERPGWIFDSSFGRHIYIGQDRFQRKGKIQR